MSGHHLDVRPSPSNSRHPSYLSQQKYGTHQLNYDANSVPRTTVVDPSASASSSPSYLDIFDVHIAQSRDDYEWFLAERVRLEDKFADDLALLTARTRAIDNGVEYTSGRQSALSGNALVGIKVAWRALRENTEQEFEAHRAFAFALKEDVLKPLQVLNATETRIANRIRDDVRSSHEKYEEQANILLKLQKAYNKAAGSYADQIPSPQPLTSPSLYPQPSRGPNMTANPSVSSNQSSPTSINSTAHPGAPLPPLSQFGHQPQHHSAASSIHTSQPQSITDQLRAGVQSRDREALVSGINELASTGKKQINSFFTGLRDRSDSKRESTQGAQGGTGASSSDDGGATSPGVLGGRLRSGSGSGGLLGRGSIDEGREREREEERLRKEKERAEREREREREKAELGAARVGKLKREMEEADLKYRTAVFHLESLRINMERVERGGVNSALEFVGELIETLSTSFSRFSTNLRATSLMVSQLASRSEDACLGIDKQRDLEAGTNGMRWSREVPLGKVLYQNYFVGPCKDLIFGVSLQDYAFARAWRDPRRIPLIVEKCIVAIESRGLDSEGLYRISPRHARLQEIQHQIEIDEAAFHFSPNEEPATIAATLKLYLRRLPEPLFRWPLQERIAFSKEREEHERNGFAGLKRKLGRLPSIHVRTLRALIHHLAKVAFSNNKMDVRALSIIFSSILFGEDDLQDVASLGLLQSSTDTAFETLLSNSTILFDSPPSTPIAGTQHRPGPGLGGSISRTQSFRTPNSQQQYQQPSFSPNGCESRLPASATLTRANTSSRSTTGGHSPLRFHQPQVQYHQQHYPLQHDRQVHQHHRTASAFPSSTPTSHPPSQPSSTSPFSSPAQNYNPSNTPLLSRRPSVHTAVASHSRESTNSAPSAQSSALNFVPQSAPPPGSLHRRNPSSHSPSQILQDLPPPSSTRPVNNEDERQHDLPPSLSTPPGPNHQPQHQLPPPPPAPPSASTHVQHQRQLNPSSHARSTPAPPGPSSQASPPVLPRRSSETLALSHHPPPHHQPNFPGAFLRSSPPSRSPSSAHLRTSPLQQLQPLGDNRSAWTNRSSAATRPPLLPSRPSGASSSSTTPVSSRPPKDDAGLLNIDTSSSNSPSGLSPGTTNSALRADAVRERLQNGSRSPLEQQQQLQQYVEEEERRREAEADAVGASGGVVNGLWWINEREGTN